ncbi:hypothetical protein [Prevotella sp. 10(H)]|uniref:hypothetical protein n=1 Tax=Prevotella sp. 10(H) TaxID=1158294 RepID=UPI0004A7490F|nr:hypothetical protein [Prevotella sp. 10(H)]
MKKILTLSFLFSFCISLSAQINLNDSTVQTVAYWDKGDVYEYQIINKRTQYKNAQLISCDSLIYNVDITVLDSTANSYTIEWLYKDNINKGLKIVYKTNEMGEFDEVMNWDEIRKFLEKAADTMTQNKDTDIETVGVKEIIQYHMFYGMKYKVDELIETETAIPNVFGAEPFTAETTYLLEEIYSDETYLVTAVQTISKEELAAATIGYLKKISAATGNPIDENSLRNMEFENKVITLSEIHNAGVIISSVQQTKVTNGDITIVKECSIELE